MRLHIRLPFIALCAFAALGVAACAALIGVRDLQEVPASDGMAGDLDSEVDARSTEDAADVLDAAACTADLDNDRNHCGACGHDCSGGTCASGLCTLVDGVLGLSKLAVRDGTIYLTAAYEVSALQRCPSAGCINGSVPLVSPGVELVAARIAVDDVNVYVADSYGFNPGGVIRASTGGGSIARLPSEEAGLPRSLGLALGPSAVYWTSDTSNGSVFYCDKPSCTNGMKVATAASSPDLVAVADTGALVWFERGRTSLKACDSPTSCTPRAFPPFTGNGVDLIIAGANVYWSTWSATDGKLLSCPVSGCTTPTTITSGQGYVAAIAVAETSMFWTAIPIGDAGDLKLTEGVVRRCTISNCAATTRDVALRQSSPSGIAVDSTSIYWVNAGAFPIRTDVAGSLVKAPR